MGGVSSLANLGLNVALSQQAAQKKNRDLEKDRDRQIAAIMRDDREAERKQASALRRRQASERARAGAFVALRSVASVTACCRHQSRQSPRRCSGDR